MRLLYVSGRMANLAAELTDATRGNADDAAARERRLGLLNSFRDDARPAGAAALLPPREFDTLPEFFAHIRKEHPTPPAADQTSP